MRICNVMFSVVIVSLVSFFADPAHSAAKKVKKTTSEKKDSRGLSAVSKSSLTGKRVALVIGNGKYFNAPLRNPVNDAKDISAKLQELDFKVIERTNLTAKQIGGALREFRSQLEPGSVALVFYAGHGIQIKGDNYLPAVDAEISSPEDVPNQSLSVKQIMDVLDESKSRLNLVFLDACRNNPYSRSFRSAEDGLARVSAPSGTLISYATRPGSVAADGEGRNGLYTSKLLVQMDSHQQIEQTLKRVVSEVKAASNGKQEPWMEGSIEGDFCFAGCVASANSNTQVANAGAVSAGVRVKSPEEIEQETWESARISNNQAVINEYLNQYPNGRFSGQARVLIAAKLSEPATASDRENAELVLWEEVQKNNTVEEYASYLAQFPTGKFSALAKKRIKKISDEAAAKAKEELALANAKLREEAQEASKQLAAAETGNIDAMKKIAEYYEAGTGVKKDPSKAAIWRSKATEQEAFQSEVDKAQEELRAAQAGDIQAMRNVADRCETGSGFKKDLELAQTWRQRADKLERQQVAVAREQAERQQAEDARQQAEQAAAEAERQQVAAQAARQEAEAAKARHKAKQIADFKYFENAKQMEKGNALEVTSSPLGTAFDILTLPSKTSEMEKLKNQAVLRPSTWGHPDSMIARASRQIEARNANADNALLLVATK